MINVAVLGHGTIGSGVVEVLQTNAAVIAKRVGEDIAVKYILDLRDFPGDPNADKVVHDYDIIDKDSDIQVVVECMGCLLYTSNLKKHRRLKQYQSSDRQGFRK